MIGKQALLKALEDFHRLTHLSASEMLHAIETLTEAASNTGKAMEDLGKILYDVKKEIANDKPRGVIPDKFKNNIHLRKPVRK